MGQDNSEEVEMSPKRRDFIKSCALAAGSVLAGSYSISAKKQGFQGNNLQEMPRRNLGKTGERLSVIGLGGMVLKDMESKRAEKIVGQSIDRGVNYFDVAPTYGDAELKMGPALKPYRKKVFIACKTTQRDKKGAEEELHRSLKRMQTDYFDLYQLHAISDVEKDVKAALSSNGAIQAFLKAREKGQIRFLGFSAHSDEAALFAMRNYDFDTLLYPVNFTCHFRGNFDQKVLDEAKKRNMGILAIKAMAKQKWSREAEREDYPKCWYEPVTDPFLARLALNWTLSQGVTAAVPPSNEGLYKLAVILGPRVRKINPVETKELEKISKYLSPIFQA
jgi:aryl-alcohol dehydrogenase-like predicted oxidoreductase